MNKFQYKFGLQFIINILVLGTLLELVSRALITLIANSASSSETALCYFIILIQGLFNTVAIVTSVFFTQNTLSKKDILALDNPSIFYTLFSIIMIIVNVIGSIIGFSSIYNICVGNISTTVMQTELMKSHSLTFEEATEKVQELLYHTVLLAIIIENIIQAVIFALFTPIYKKYHKKVFNY